MSDIHDVLAPIAKPLTPANQNPWYVLMTLYGEALGERESFDWELHRKNARAWNTWVLSKLNEAEQQEVRENFSHLETLPEKTGEAELAEILAKFDVVAAPSNFTSAALDELSAVSFENILFSNGLTSSGMIFLTDVEFFNCTFEDSLDLSGFSCEPLTIDKCNIGSHLSFTESTCSELNIYDCTIFGNAYFSDSTFFNGINIAGSLFKREVDFSGCEFFGRALLHRATFEGSVDFRFAFFKDSEGRGPTFNLTRFGGPTSFWKARFSSAYPDFDGAILHAETTFSAEEGDADGPFWPKSINDPTTAKDSCAKIRNNIGKQGFPEAEHFFYRREMKFAGLAATNPFEKFAYVLFGVLSDYGYSFVRPLAALAFLFAFGFLAHWGYFSSGAARVETGWTALGISFSNLFPYFGIGRYFDPKALQMLPTALKAIGATQTVFGAVLLFLLALGLRTRFRMR